MFTIVESPTFQRLWPDYWTEEERGEFAAWIAHFPDAGDVVPRSGGVRKVRWSRAGTGVRSGVRVIYFNRISQEQICLLLIYAKSARDNIAPELLQQLRKDMENAND